MIINVRGTHGSGKTTLVRKIIESWPCVKTVIEKGRTKPSLTLLEDGENYLIVLGHYEIDNGGADTLTWNAEQRRNHILELSKLAPVLYEGPTGQDGIAWMKDHKDTHVIFIKAATPECLRNVRKRGHSLSKKRVVDVQAKCEREYREMVKWNWKSRVQRLEWPAALKHLRKLVRAPTPSKRVRSVSKSSSVRAATCVVVSAGSRGSDRRTRKVRIISL